MRPGRNSAAVGDFQLTRSARCFSIRRVFRYTVFFETLIAEVFSWTKPDVCPVDRPRRQFVRPKPTVAAHPRAALRVPVASRSDRCRKRVIAPPTESRRWPETPSSVGQIPHGGLVGADRIGRNDRRRQICWCRPRSIPARVAEQPVSTGIVGADRVAPARGYPSDQRRQKRPEGIGRQSVGPALRDLEP
jgi:hypothetical protein